MTSTMVYPVPLGHFPWTIYKESPVKSGTRFASALAGPTCRHIDKLLALLRFDQARRTHCGVTSKKTKTFQYVEFIRLERQATRRLQEARNKRERMEQDVAKRL